jgi:hypothetical protein
MTAEPLVIGTTSRSRAVLGMLIPLGVGVFVAYLWFDAARDWEAFFSSRSSRTGVPTITLLWLVMLGVFVKLLRQNTSHGGRTIWIENGRLIFYYPSYFSVPLADITGLSLTYDFFGRKQVWISLRDGGGRKFYLTAMTASPDAILKRLREACGLPEPAPSAVHE